MRKAHWPELIGLGFMAIGFPTAISWHLIRERQSYGSIRKVVMLGLWCGTGMVMLPFWAAGYGMLIVDDYLNERKMR